MNDMKRCGLAPSCADERVQDDVNVEKVEVGDDTIHNRPKIQLTTASMSVKTY